MQVEPRQASEERIRIVKTTADKSIDGGVNYQKLFNMPELSRVEINIKSNFIFQFKDVLLLKTLSTRLLYREK